MFSEKKPEEPDERSKRLSEHDDRYKGTIPARELLRALWPYLRPHRGRLGVTLLATALLAGAGLVLPYLSRRAIDGVLPHATRWLCGTLGLYLVLALVAYFRIYTPWNVGESMAFRLRLDLYRHLQRLTPAFYQRRAAGEVVSRLTRDINMISPFGAWMVQLAGAVLLLAPILVYIFLINAKLAAISLAAPAVYALLACVFLPRVRDLALGVRARMGALSGEATEGVQGMKVVQSFVREGRLAQHFQDSACGYCDEARRFHRLNAVLWSMLSRMQPVGTLVVLVYAVGAVGRGEMTKGQVFEFIFLLGMFYWPIMQLAQVSTQVFQGFGSLERIVEFFHARPEVRDEPGAIELAAPAGRVEFRDVAFAYDSGDRPAVRGVSFAAEPGTVTALVGPSGSGKSTLMDLLSRFSDPNAGSVRVDGRDAREYTLKSLRRNIGTVMQDPILFSGSVRENLRLGNPDATEEEMVEALRSASALEVVEALPRGLAQRVGERGVALSGGERQRIAIARAFLKNPKVLVLDEATSALDSESEKLIQGALDRLMKERTTFIIAHRLSTVLGADRVLVVEDGRVVERGRPAELLERRGRYARLFEEQFREAVDALAAAGAGAR